ncbi:hypothetical protein BBJ28_00002559 [Nothophytophthora sp. Chile5]|nr:hypothetical protein BBJ28_00002559 [Nothophytophthora sp. Chile5]
MQPDRWMESQSRMRSPASDEEAQHAAPALQPADEQEYVVVLGRSLTGGDVAAEGGETAAAREQQHDNDVFASFGYEFQPASVDKSTPGLVSVDGSSGVQVLMGSSTGAAGGVSFKGKVVENKDTDCLLIFDGSGFRLERCPRPEKEAPPLSPTIAMSKINKRRETDVMKLMMSDYEVHLTDETKTNDMDVKFCGPKDTPYEGGSWKIHVTLPKDYPFKSPSIGFVNRIYHPNVDETCVSSSGMDRRLFLRGAPCSVRFRRLWRQFEPDSRWKLTSGLCSAELVNIFEVFIPQLLRYPNPSDPLNGEAASLLMKDADSYNNKVKEYVRNYASQHIEMGGEDEDSDVSDMSDVE